MTVSLPGFVVTRRTNAERAEAAAAGEGDGGLYGGTPASRPVLELHGWKPSPTSCTPCRSSRREDEWTAMRDLVDDEVLEVRGGRGAGGGGPGHSGGGSTVWSTGQRLRVLSRAAGPLGAAGRSVPLTARPRPGPSGILDMKIVVSSWRVLPDASVRAAVALAAIGALALTRCSDSRSAGNGAAVGSGDTAACPGEVIEVVVSVGQWGDVVGQLGGDCAEVTTIVTSGALDPHEFEPGRPTSPRSPAPTS